MINNPFLQQMGPQGFSPEDSAPSGQPVDPQAAYYNSALRARELQAKMGIASMVRGQQASNLGRVGMLAAREGGKYLGTTLSGSAASALGGQAASVGSQLPAEAAGSAVASAAPAAGTSVLGAAGQGLGVAATAYGTWQSNKSAGQSIADLKDAIAGGNLSPEEEARAREKVFNSGIQSQHIGGLGGALGGLSFGPIGTVVGGLAGASGGARQAWGSYETNPERFKAALETMKHPWKR